MKSNTEPLQPGCLYHVFNRGINRETLFRSDANYRLFLEKYKRYLLPITKTYCYCLMGNHFHFLLEINSVQEIQARFLKPGQSQKYQSKFSREENLKKFISSQFGHLFNGYAQAFNRAYSRTGGLFEDPFRRIRINNKAYFKTIVTYIHHNPQVHGFTNNFKDYPYSSYNTLISEKSTLLERSKIMDSFGSKEEFIQAHSFKSDNHLDIDW